MERCVSSFSFLYFVSHNTSVVLVVSYPSAAAVYVFSRVHSFQVVLLVLLVVAVGSSRPASDLAHKPRVVSCSGPRFGWKTPCCKILD